MSAALAVVVGAVTGLALYFYCSSQKDGGRARSGIDPTTGESLYSHSNRMDTLRCKVPESNEDESSGWGRGSQAQRDFAMSEAERAFATSQAEQDFRRSRGSSQHSRSSHAGHERESREAHRQTVSNSHSDRAATPTDRTGNARNSSDVRSDRSGRRRRVTTYTKETYDRNVTRSRTTPNVDHSPVPEMRHFKHDDHDIKPIENPQIHTHHDSVDEKHVEQGFQRSEKSEEHMEKETHSSTQS